MARLTANSYGKCDVRLTKVVRTGATHTLWELTASIVLTGDFARIYTNGDNSPCIPTDTMKNTVYALAKKNDFASPEEFGQILARHFIERFDHVADRRGVDRPEDLDPHSRGREAPRSFILERGIGTPHVRGQRDSAGRAPCQRRTCRAGGDQDDGVGVRGVSAGRIHDAAGHDGPDPRDEHRCDVGLPSSAPSPDCNAVFEAAIRVIPGNIRAARKPERSADDLRDGRGAAGPGA